MKLWHDWCNDHLVYTYENLGETFYSKCEPTPLKNIELNHFNFGLAEQLQFDQKTFFSDDVQSFFNSNLKLQEHTPISTVYSGHQFGQWAGQLGDGRAHLLGELKSEDGLYDLQLKGAGLTPYSRMGDGRAVWRSSVREYLASEAMHHLDIPTSRALAIWDSEEEIYRETVESGALVLRAGKCFVRFGTFEHFNSKNDTVALKTLLNYSIDRWYNELADSKQPVKDFILAVSEKTASLMCKWMGVGFCHGVMNTDNMAINGDTIDYGPYGFVDHFNYYHICNHSDNQGRYKYSDQPNVGIWNLFRLRDALESLMDENDTLSQEELKEFYTKDYKQKSDKMWSEKLGVNVSQEVLHEIIGDTFGLLHNNKIDWTQFWRALSHQEPSPGIEFITELGGPEQEAQEWLDLYLKYKDQEQWNHTKIEMLKTNPKFILRNHLLQRWIAIESTEERSKTFDDILKVFQSPFDEHSEFEDWAQPPEEAEAGFIPSCSS